MTRVATGGPQATGRRGPPRPARRPELRESKAYPPRPSLPALANSFSEINIGARYGDAWLSRLLEFWPPCWAAHWPRGAAWSRAPARSWSGPPPAGTAPGPARAHRCGTAGRRRRPAAGGSRAARRRRTAAARCPARPAARTPGLSATPRLSSTTGDGLIWARPSYSAVIRSQSVSSATVARAWQAAIAACRAYGPAVPPSSSIRSMFGKPASDQQPVPARAVLVEQQHGLTVRPGTGPQPGRLDLDQREQPQRLGVPRRQAGQHPAEPERLRAQVAADPLVAAGRGVALVEDQVDDLADGSRAEPAARLGRGARTGRSPRPACAWPGRCAGRSSPRGQERPGDVLGGQTADQLEGQRRARVRRQDRVAGHEDQPEQVVGQVAVDDLVEVGLQPAGSSGRPAVLAALGVAAADPVDGQDTAPSCSARPPGCPARRPAATSRSPPRRRPGRAPRRCRGRRPTHQPGDHPRRLDPPQRRHRDRARRRRFASASRIGQSVAVAVRPGCSGGPRTRPPGVRRPARCRRAARTCGRARRPRRASRPRGSRSRRSAPWPRRTARR